MSIVDLDQGVISVMNVDPAAASPMALEGCVLRVCVADVCV